MTGEAAVMPLSLEAAKTLVDPWKVEDAVALFLSAGFPDGEIIAHDVLSGLIGVPVDSPLMEYREAERNGLQRLQRRDKLFMRLLTEHNIYLRNVWATGYQIIAPSEQASVANSDLMQEINKELKKAALIMKHIRQNELSNHDRRRHNDADVKLAALAEMIGSVRKNFLTRDDTDNERIF